MKTLLIEDEAPAARRLQKLLRELDPQIEILETLDSVEATAQWFGSAEASPDLAFMDIHLSDGLSFEIFGRVSVPCPVIFTTAYDEYSLRAFKVNSVDYLLKPINADELRRSVEKFQHLRSLFAANAALVQDQQPNAPSPELFQAFMKSFLAQEPPYKSRFLVQQRDRLLTIPVEQAAYFYSEHKLTHLVTTANSTHVLDHTLEELENQLNPRDFFRANRQFIVHFSSIADIHTYFNGKLKLTLSPAVKSSLADDLVISRDKSTPFKQWLDR